MSLKYPASGERGQFGQIPSQSSSHVDCDFEIFALDVLSEMDGRESKKCWIGIERKIPEISR